MDSVLAHGVPLADRREQACSKSDSYSVAASRQPNRRSIPFLRDRIEGGPVPAPQGRCPQNGVDEPVDRVRAELEAGGRTLARVDDQSARPPTSATMGIVP